MSTRGEAPAALGWGRAAVALCDPQLLFWKLDCGKACFCAVLVYFIGPEACTARVSVGLFVRRRFVVTFSMYTPLMVWHGAYVVPCQGTPLCGSMQLCVAAKWFRHGFPQQYVRVFVVVAIGVVMFA